MRAALGWVLMLAGGVWVLQGRDVSWAPQSAMTGDWRWVLGGSVTLLIGLGLVLWNHRRKSEGKSDVS